MPQLTLTDGELVKKTLRTTLVMLGSTAVWLAALTGAVVVTTGSNSAGADSKADKAEKASAGMPMTAPMPGALKGGAAMPGPRNMHRAGSPPKAEPSHAGNPI